MSILRTNKVIVVNPHTKIFFLLLVLISKTRHPSTPAQSQSFRTSVKMLHSSQKPGLQSPLNAPSAKLPLLPHENDIRLLAYVTFAQAERSVLVLGILTHNIYCSLNTYIIIILSAIFATQLALNLFV